MLVSPKKYITANGVVVLKCIIIITKVSMQYNELATAITASQGL